MRAIILSAAVAATLALVSTNVLAQEMVPTPDPVGGANVNAGTGATAVAPTQPNSAAVDQWRYRWLNGRWWYWTRQNRWMWYSDDGRWVDFNASGGPPAVAQSGEYPAPAPFPVPGYYYRGPAYWTGYYPGVGVGVGPYGNVGVGVGRRIGVDVSGPHGGVRVGPIRVGW